jgi:hypothetical protein
MNNAQNSVQPHEVSEPIKGAVEVMQGNSRKLPEVMQHAGNLLMKYRNKLSTPQLVLVVGALAVGLVMATKSLTNNRQMAM